MNSDYIAVKGIDNCLSILGEPVEKEDLFLSDQTLVTGDKPIFGIVNPDTGYLHSVVSKNYRLVRHIDAFEGALRVFNSKSIPNDIQIYPSAKISNNGSLAEIKFVIDVPYDIGNGDVIKPSVNILNSYDKTRRFSAMIGAYRLVCSNGLVIGEKWATVTGIHLNSVDILKDISDTVEEIVCVGLEKIAKQVQEWASWNDQRMTVEDTTTLLEKIQPVVGKRKMQDLAVLPEASSGFTFMNFLDRAKTGILKADDYPTKWEVYNIFMEFSTHSLPMEKRLQMNSIISEAMPKAA